MGLIENMVGSMSGGAGLTSPMLTLAMRGVVGAGDSPGPGIPWLLDRLEQAGLSREVQSWKRDGPGLPITGAQLRGALGDAEVSRMAARVGLLPDEFIAKLSQHLPGVIGQLGEKSALDQASAG